MTTAVLQPPSLFASPPPETGEFPRVVGLNDNGRRMTIEEFDAIEDYDDEYRYELIEGILIVNAAPGPVEVDPNEELGFLLRLFAQQTPGVIDKTISEQYIRTHRSRRRADRVIWIGLGHVPNIPQDIPTIAVEFLSAGRRSWQRDYVQKLEEYLAAGVKEYWLFDRFRRHLAVFRPKTEGGVETTVATAGMVYATPLLPGFELSIDRLLKCADDWIAIDTEVEPS